MANALTTRQERETGRFPHIAGRLIDSFAVDCIAKFDAKDRHGNDRAVEEIEARAVELAGPSPSPVLRSVSLTVALCEFDVRARQGIDGPLTDVERRQRNLDRSMRRYLAAVRTLAVVQRAGLPPIQVNIAEQQVVSNR
jgi:hypothetical protein